MLEKERKGIFACGRCGKCIVHHGDYVCPVQQHTGGFNETVAMGRNAIARAYLEGNLELTDDVIANTYNCLMCNSCYVACQKPGPDHKPIINESKITQAFRVDIVKAGLEPEPLKKIDQVIETSHNPFGNEPSKRSGWADGLDLDCKGDVVYFAGCYAAYRNPKLAQATVRILSAGGIDVAFMGEEEWCCGVPQLGDGNMELAEKMIEHNINALKAAGAKTVITSCAGCFHALKTEYAEIAGELPFEVKHSSEVISELIEEGKLSFTKSLDCKVTYHDPCHLGRHEKVYDAPRKIISAIPGVEFTEMRRTKEKSWCCGGGSIVSNIYPDLTSEIADDRVSEAKETGADVILSACPSCESILGVAGRKSKIKVEDINLLIAEAL